MKITFENTFKKEYIEVLPSLSVGLRPFTIYFGWIFFSVMVVKN